MKKNIIQLATRIATKSTNRSKHGAVVHRNGQIFSFGCNDGLKTHPLYRDKNNKYNLGHHAELSALLGVRYSSAKNLELTVVRVSRKTNKLTSSKPCKHCMSIIKMFGIKEIHYSNENGEFETIKL